MYTARTFISNVEDQSELEHEKATSSAYRSINIEEGNSEHFSPYYDGQQKQQQGRSDANPY